MPAGLAVSHTCRTQHTPARELGCLSELSAIVRAGRTVCLPPPCGDHGGVNIAELEELNLSGVGGPVGKLVGFCRHGGAGGCMVHRGQPRTAEDL